MKNNNKGFTIVEMVSLIAIIGTLVLLALPKFNGLIGKAETINISNDLNVMETVVLTSMMMNKDLPIDKNERPIEASELEEKILNNMIFNKQGIIKQEDIDMETAFYRLDKNFIESETISRLEGEFILNSDGDVLYINSNRKLASNSIDLGNMLEEIKDII